MTGSFGIDVSLHLENLAAVLTALRQLEKPPGWLVAVEDLGRVRTDFEGAVPELGAGVPAWSGSNSSVPIWRTATGSPCTG